DPHDTDAATDPSPEEATTAEAGPSAGSLDEDDPSGASGRTADVPPAASADSPATRPPWISGTAGATVLVPHRGRTCQATQGDPLFAVASKHGFSVPSLAELNRISPRQTLRQGQVLSLPEKNDLPDEDPSH